MLKHFTVKLTCDVVDDRLVAVAIVSSPGAASTRHATVCYLGEARDPGSYDYGTAVADAVVKHRQELGELRGVSALLGAKDADAYQAASDEASHG